MFIFMAYGATADVISFLKYKKRSGASNASDVETSLIG